MRNLFVESKVVAISLLVSSMALSAGSLPGKALAAQPGSEIEADASPFSDACRRFQTGHVRSAARKLFRALRGEHVLQPLLLQPWVDATVEGRALRFEVHTEHDGLVGGLVPDGGVHASTYVVAQTEAGPVVVALTWAPEGGSCRVEQTRLVYPEVASEKVRPEPFRLWGQRVVWHLPRTREKGGARDPYAALMAVFREPSTQPGAPARQRREFEVQEPEGKKPEGKKPEPAPPESKEPAPEKESQQGPAEASVQK